MNFDLSIFEQQYTLYFGKLTHNEKYHLTFILNKAETDSNIREVNQLAYMLATARWETSYFNHLEEEGSEESFEKYQNKYGNNRPGDGKKYRGRGYVQITFWDNYERVGEKLNIDLVHNPSQAKEPECAYKILTQGCLEGWFTGKRLGNYISEGDSKCDYWNARYVVNPNEIDIANRAINLSNKSEHQQQCIGAVSTIQKWSVAFEKILQKLLLNEQLTEIPDEFIVDAPSDTESMPKLQANEPQAVNFPSKKEIQTGNSSASKLEPTSFVSSVLPTTSKDIANNINTNNATKVFLEGSAAAVKRLTATLLGSGVAFITIIGAFIKSEPIITGIIVIVALIGLIWLISFYLYLEHKIILPSSERSKN